MTFYLPEGLRNIEIAFEYYPSANATPSSQDLKGSASVFKFEIKGSDKGGAYDCTKCPSGHISSISAPYTCDLCAYGHEPNMECKNEFA